jgi:hypothetical protein
MRDLRQNIIALLLLILAGCKQSGQEVGLEKVVISKVTVGLSGNGCESACPFQAVSVDNKQALLYYGGPYATNKGYFKGNVTKATWDSIQTRFARLCTAGVDTLEWERTDFPEVELYIKSSKGVYKLRKNVGKISEADTHLLAWFVYAISKEIKLNASDSLGFETHIQYETVPEIKR